MGQKQINCRFTNTKITPNYANEYQILNTTVGAEKCQNEIAEHVTEKSVVIVEIEKEQIILNLCQKCKLTHNENYCCECDVNFGKEKHCCECRMNYQERHCCECRMNYQEKHCCECRMNYQEKHCCKCMMNYKDKHCCKCKSNLGKFDYHCKDCCKTIKTAYKTVINYSYGNPFYMYEIYHEDKYIYTPKIGQDISTIDDVITHMKNYHCCRCDIKPQYNSPHCCKCLTVRSVGFSHCCECKFDYPEKEKHCCKCRNSYKFEHCCECKQRFRKEDYHCTKHGKHFITQKSENCIACTKEIDPVCGQIISEEEVKKYSETVDGVVYASS
jgi:hypothetical protein